MSARGAVVSIMRPASDVAIARKLGCQRRCHFVRNRLVFTSENERRNLQTHSRAVQKIRAISLGAPQDNKAGAAESGVL